MRSIPNDGRYTICKPLPQFLRRFPTNVIVLACIEMDIVVVQHVPSTGKKDLDTASMCKASFVIDTSASSILSLGEISDNKARAFDFGNDPVVYLVVMFLLINPDRFVSCIFNSKFNTFFPCFLGGVIKPHGHKTL